MGAVQQQEEEVRAQRKLSGRKSFLIWIMYDDGDVDNSLTVIFKPLLIGWDRFCINCGLFRVNNSLINEYLVTFKVAVDLHQAENLINLLRECCG